MKYACTVVVFIGMGKDLRFDLDLRPGNLDLRHDDLGLDSLEWTRS